MASLIKNIGSKIWFFPILLLLFNCEKENPTTEIDYTGQSGIVTDIENNTYKTIGIGTQIWMAENLATVTLNDGSRISQIVNDSIWGWNRDPAYCTYKHDSLNYKEIFGLLYNYYTVKTGLICPIGWHVPTYEDWNLLGKFLGGNDKAGGKLKDMNYQWDGPNYGFTTTYSFNALPGGGRIIYLYHIPRFEAIGTKAYWWTSDSVDFLQSRAIYIENSNTNLHAYDERKASGFNIRCLKNNTKR